MRLKPHHITPKKRFTKQFQRIRRGWLSYWVARRRVWVITHKSYFPQWYWETKPFHNLEEAAKWVQAEKGAETCRAAIDLFVSR